MPRRKKKRNRLGFTERQLKILLNYCKATRGDPRITYQQVHKYYSSYARRQTTINLIHKGYKKEVITGPVLYANTGIEVSFLKDVDDPINLLNKCEKDNKTTLAFALDGHWSFIWFKHGANTLQYADAILPHSYSNNRYQIEDITFNEKGLLPEDMYPHRWSKCHWKIYQMMASPRDVMFKDVVKNIDLSWKTMKKYYLEVLKQCKIQNCFFPLGKEGYSHQLVTFKTDYEIGVLNALKKLNRTTFIYKANGIIILVLNLIPRPKDFNISTNKFRKLEEEGYIRDLHICTPRKWYHY